MRVTRFLRRKTRISDVGVYFLVSWMIAGGLSIALAGVGFWRNTSAGSFRSSIGWDLINTTSFIFVLYTIASVIATHRVDERREARGIRHSYKTLRSPKMAREPDIILAIMQRQNIHVAIALGLLVAIFQSHFLEPRGRVSAITDIIKQFRICVAWIVTLGFALSVVLILVSALSYDYSCRFNWEEAHKRSLMRKGMKLDIWSWYAFTVSLILSIALVSPILCILINFSYGFLLLYYYFFTDDVKLEKTPSPTP